MSLVASSLSIAAAFPPTTGGGGQFAVTLFSTIATTCLSVMTGTGVIRDMVDDRRYETMASSVTAIRMLVALMCATLVLYCAPQAAYFLGYADAGEAGRATMLLVKRYCDGLALVPLAAWLAYYKIYEPRIILSLKSPSSRVYLSRSWVRPLRDCIIVIAGVAMLAGLITYGRSYPSTIHQQAPSR